jgi:hypothetical protein
MPATGTYIQYPELIDALPPLVRKQRRLEATIAAVAADVIEEKEVKAEIDQLLVAAGLQKSEEVSCNGYDVRHNERDGASKLNPIKVTEQLLAAGVAHELVAQVLMNSTETGSPASFCTIKPSKGSKVRV